MNIDGIIRQREVLDKELRIALSTMERSNKVFEIKKAIIENQKRCPHVDANYSWAVIDGKCPYCGFQLSEENREY